MNTTSQLPQFPDLPHRELLRQKCEAPTGLDIKRLTDDERWHWFAYHYGWKRTFLLNDERSLAIDPRGEWYDAGLATKAALMWAGNRTPKPHVSPADEAAHRGDLDQASRYREQDRKRAEFAATVSAWHNPDGTPSPEALRYVAGCMRQVKANMAEFLARNHAALGLHVDPQPGTALDDAAD